MDGPPQASYRALRSGQIIGLDGCPGIRPVGVGETCWRLLEKCVLEVTGAEDKEACKMDQLCGGSKYGIEEGIHAVQLLWQQHSQKKDWGFLIIERCNAFN